MQVEAKGQVFMTKMELTIDQTFRETIARRYGIKPENVSGQHVHMAVSEALDAWLKKQEIKQ